MPLTKTKTYARILETQGFKQEALEIYEELLKENEDSEILEAIQRLKKRKFFVLKEREGTVPKLLYLFPENDAHFAENSIAHNTTIHTWESFKPIIEKAKTKRKSQWKSI